MIAMKMRSTAATIVCYYWLGEEELDTIFVGEHKWWFSHCMLFSHCVFYGPKITRDREIWQGGLRISIYSQSWSLEEIERTMGLYDMNGDSLLSFVVESGLSLPVEELKRSKLKKLALVGDTHHLSNPISSAIELLERICVDAFCISHKAHEEIFRLGTQIKIVDFPYSEVDSMGSLEEALVFRRVRMATYCGNRSDLFHPRRTIVVNRLIDARCGVEIVPRQQIKEWLGIVRQSSLSVTCSLNGFPSYQSYAPLLFGSCLVTDTLSTRSRLGYVLRDGVNCLMYSGYEELVEAVCWAGKNLEVVRKIGVEGRKTVAEIVNGRFKTLMEFARLMDKEDGFESRITCNDEDGIYLYEVVQEIHRNAEEIVVTIEADTLQKAEKYQRILEILPRVSVVSLAKGKGGKCGSKGNSGSCTHVGITATRISGIESVLSSIRLDIEIPSGMVSRINEQKAVGLTGNMTDITPFPIFEQRVPAGWRISWANEGQ